MAFPGSFPASPSPPRTLSPSSLTMPLSPTSSRDVSLSPTPNQSSRSTSKSSGVQSRRSAHSLGLGVSFALPPFSPSPAASTSSASSHGQSRSQSRSHSRHSSMSSGGWDSDMPFPLSPSLLASPSPSDYNPTPTTSRHASRRPSLTHLASFLSGIEHHTRVRSPGVNGGRGVSRSASRSGSRVGVDRRKDSSSRRSSILVDQPPYSSWRPYQPDDEEEPFLETAPNSPLGRVRSFASIADSEHDGLAGVDVFEEGERVGVGVWLEGRGGWARDCFAGENAGDEGVANGFGGPGELEVVRRLGEGTYAIVYLVKEVLYDPDPYKDGGSGALSPIDATTAFDFSGMSSTPTPASWAADPFLPSTEPTYGRSFALKCLCKKDLTDELIEIQRGEAVLHRALPDHENVVRLYGAYETDDWLFLVLEYCPGQDLFFWLQADDEDLYELHSRAASPFQQHHSLPASPPSAPSVPLAINGIAPSSPEDDSALSRTLTGPTHAFPSAPGEADHTPPSPSLLSSTADASLLSRKRLRLISRMFSQMCNAVQACHDVGISHRDIKPENFIVGERAGRVVVKITDWGLGTREMECEDFDCGSKPYMAYECRNNLNPTYDPRQADVWSLGLVLLNLLYHRNPWADPSLTDPDFAAYVADPVGFFEDRFEGIGVEVATFLSTRVFCDVLEMEGDSLRRRVTAGEFGRWASRLVMIMGEGVGRQRGSVSDSTFHLVSSRPPSSAQTAPAAASLLSQYAPAASPTPPPESPAHQELPEIQETDEEKLQPAALGSPNSIGESLPSPSFPPPATLFDPATSPMDSPSPSQPVDMPASNDGATRPPLEAALSARSDDLRHQFDEGGDVKCWGEPDTINPKAKRRKRGARKGRSATPRQPGDTSPPTPSPLSPGSPTAPPSIDEARERKLAELATASENLARELSKTVRPSLRPSHSVGTQSLRATASSADLSSSNRKASLAKASNGGVFGRMRGLVMDGNQDLNALKKRAQERNASFGDKADTYSAPAKMQAGRPSGISSAKSYDAGTSSWGSIKSRASDADDLPRGRDGADGHWSSAAGRRERQLRRRAGDLSPSSTRLSAASTTFDSRNHTPLSSFSSVNSQDYAQVPGSVVTVRDWRQPSPSPSVRPYSTSRPRESPPLSTSKPKLKDASTDTADLPSQIALPVSAARPMSATSKSSVTTIEAPAPLPAAPTKKNKLGTLLNSISVFNRSQER